jgi:hypothetical protein
MGKNYKIIHIEDDAKWQNIVRTVLKDHLIDLVSMGSLEEFRSTEDIRADLYICDRHLPEKKGKNPNDGCWKAVINTLAVCYPYSPVLVLSHKPQKDWRKYQNIKSVFDKNIFEGKEFVNKINFYLGK